MSDEGDDIERYRRRSGRVESDRGPIRNERAPSPDSDGRDGARGKDTAGTIADVAGTIDGEPVAVSTESVVATLVGVPSIDLEAFAYDHQLDSSTEAGERRPAALFDLENTCDRPIRWNASRTQFVGDDEYTYQPAHISLDPSTLGPGCHTRQVEIEPGRRARMITLVERLPPGVDVAEVVHTLSLTRGGTERLVFAVESQR